MTRLALGAKWGKPGSPCCWRSAFRSEANARPEKKRRVMFVQSMFVQSLFGDGLVHVEHQAGDAGPGRQFCRVRDADRRFAFLHKLLRCRWVTVKFVRHASFGRQQDLLLSVRRRARQQQLVSVVDACFGVFPPSFMMRSANLRDASRKVTSFIRSSAWSGELVRFSNDRALLAVGRIEIHHVRRRRRAFPPGVEAAAIEIPAFRLLVALPPASSCHRPSG